MREGKTQIQGCRECGYVKEIRKRVEIKSELEVGWGELRERMGGEGERGKGRERERPSATERGEPKGGIADRPERECVMCASQMQPRHGQAHTYLPTVPYTVSLTVPFSTSNVCGKSSDNKILSATTSGLG